MDREAGITALDGELSPYRALYYRWEQEQWSAEAIELDADRGVSETLDPGFRDDVLLLYAMSEQATDSLVPFVDAAPAEEQHVFLTTQLVDAARHVVFFGRVHRELLAADSEASSASDARDVLTSGARSLLYEMLPEVVERLRRAPDDPRGLVEGVTLWHLVIAGTLGLTTQKFLLGRLSSSAALPGFRAGCASVTRDVSRHVDFALRFLDDAVSENPASATAIRQTADAALPLLRAAFGVAADLPHGPEETKSWALESLRKRLRSIGPGIAV